MHTRRAVGAARVLVDRLNALIKRNVLAVAIGKIPTPPGIVARAREAKDAAEGGDGSDRLIVGEEESYKTYYDSDYLAWVLPQMPASQRRDPLAYLYGIAERVLANPVVQRFDNYVRSLR